MTARRPSALLRIGLLGLSVTAVLAFGVACHRSAEDGVGRARPAPGSVSRSSTSPGPSPLVDSRELKTVALLRRQTHALAAGDRAAYLAGWSGAPSSQRLAGVTYRDIDALGMDRLTAELDEGVVADTGAVWTAAVRVTWSLTGGEGAAESEVRYTFAERGGRAVVVHVAALQSRPEPVWLLPGLNVRRTSGMLVAATDRRAALRLARLLPEAAKAVTSVLPGWHGRLVAYAPASARQFDALVNAVPGQYRGIAAVTTTVDGSHDASAPSAIVVNPAVFGSLGPLGARVVVTHEATHAATHVAAIDMAPWLAEGFADYVALRSVDVPLPVAAREALAAVRRDGAPTSLPGPGAFAASGARLQAAYQQAWLAASLIARTYGQPRLVAFYRFAESRPDELGAAFRRTLHTSQGAFVRAWGRYLARLAADRQ